MSIDPKTIELINEDLDGELADADRALLDARLAADPEARRLRDELAAACAELERLEKLDPPRALSASVLERIGADRSTPVATTGPSGFRNTFLEWLALPAVRYAMSFGGGVVLTLALISSTRNADLAFDDVTNLVGSIIGSDTDIRAPAEGALTLSLNQITGTVSARRSGPILIVDFDLASREPVEIVAEFDNRDLWFHGFAQLESRGTSIAAETGRFTVRMQGQRRYAVYLRNDGGDTATLRLRFLASGRSVHEGEIRIGDGNR